MVLRSNNVPYSHHLRFRKLHSRPQPIKLPSWISKSQHRGSLFFCPFPILGTHGTHLEVTLTNIMKAEILSIQISLWVLALYILTCDARPPLENTLIPKSHNSTDPFTVLISNQTTISSTFRTMPTHPHVKPRQEEPPAEIAPSKETENKNSQKSYEGDLIASGQPDPVVKGAETSAAKKLIPLYVIAGIVVLVVGVIVFWVITHSCRWRG